MLANYQDVPRDLIRAVVDANATRKDFVAEQILALDPQVVGIYRSVMKRDPTTTARPACRGS